LWGFLGWVGGFGFVFWGFVVVWGRRCLGRPKLAFGDLTVAPRPVAPTEKVIGNQICVNAIHPHNREDGVGKTRKKKTKKQSLS